MTASGARLLLELSMRLLDWRRTVRRAACRARAGGDPSAYMVTAPLKHQRAAYAFVTTLERAAVFAEQGTGKTYVGLAAIGHRIEHQGVTRILVVTRKTARHAWVKNHEQHAGYHVRFVVPEKSREIESLEPTDEPTVVVVSYGRCTSMIRDLVAWDPQMVLLDESHSIKNRRRRRARAAYKLQARYRLAFTGTPIGQWHDAPKDLWSQMKFVEPDLLGRSFRPFQDRYCEMGGYMDYEVVGLKNEDELMRRVRDVSFRVTKAECLDLPPETWERLYVEPDRKTLEVYRSMDRRFTAVVGDKTLSVQRRISAIVKLRQIVGGAVVANDRALAHVGRAKLEALSELLEDWPRGRKLVAFASFLHEIDMIDAEARRLGLRTATLTGKTRNRSEVIQSFTATQDLDMMVSQVSVGGVGIDLQVADTTVFYSPAFSFLDLYQAKDRVHRIGQRRPVTHYLILMRGTVDEDIADLLEENQRTATDLLDAKRILQEER